MSQHVSWQVELAVKPGQLESFRVLTTEMVESTKSERGVLAYERYVSDDAKSIVVYERYSDSAAAIGHLQAFATKYGARFTSMVERKRFTVFGNPSDELRTILDKFRPTYLRPFAGFFSTG
jgi:quinol monooxygenase YgiN